MHCDDSLMRDYSRRLSSESVQFCPGKPARDLFVIRGERVYSAMELRS